MVTTRFRFAILGLLIAGSLLVPVAVQAAGPTPPPVTIVQRDAGLAPGLIFISPVGFGGPFASGPEIVDDRGRLVWFQAVPAGDVVTGFRAQRYLGREVLTWWQGTGFGGPSSGVDEIVDLDHRVIATVHAGNGYQTDGHEFLITARGTALITVYNVTTADLTSIGGAAKQKVIDGIVQEVDIRTGRVLFEWHSIGHVPFADSHELLPPDPSVPWDYFHINAVHLDLDGNLLISGRHTWAVYKVERHSGDILWELGGKASSFALGLGVAFRWQHDPEAIGPGLITIFDNESNGDLGSPPSRVITVRLDTVRRTATLVSSIEQPDHLSAGSQGNAQTLRGGHVFVGWGALGRFSEFDRSGHLLFDATLPPGYASYRAYRLPLDPEDKA